MKIKEALITIRQKYQNPKVSFLGKYEDDSSIKAENAAELFSLLPADIPTKIAVAGCGSFSLSKRHRAGRLSGKIAVVTGSAQGFGEGIALGLAAQGCYVVFADLNGALAAEKAEAVNKQYQEEMAIAVQCDVTDENSVGAMIEETVRAFGGLDLFVSNAGILISGAIDKLELKEFELVTKVNYTSFFLCTKYAAEIMKLQSSLSPGASYDIIQINSKSGLEGSNKNFAYAGSKFGGIGLVQSFAKELVDYRIKVNAICPGNFYEGPLWSDKERGLFVQYLQAGKVPGAQTVDDVKRFYVDKVPMKRGCYPEDVVKAILYCVEQQYETGQALPVTGGQNMLK